MSDSRTPTAQRPLIVQGDRSVLLEVDQPGFEEARGFLMRFAELEKAPEHVHFYRIGPVSIWNAAASGLALDELLDGLEARSRYPLPRDLVAEIREWYRRYGLFRLERDREGLWLGTRDPALLDDLGRARELQPLLGPADRRGRRRIDEADRGRVKQALIALGYPVEDLAGYREGAPLPDFSLREVTREGRRFALRPYQRQAADAFWRGGSAAGGSGVIVLPCGAGKTIVALAVIDLLRTHTLVLTTNTVALRQWRRELLDKTTLSPDLIGEYSGEEKRIAPVTIATYQILTYRRERSGDFAHFDLFTAQDWGLIVYDEVHLLPAPVFRVTADLQARRRLGLTATLIREDGKESEVFGLIGPKRYDVPWKSLESDGHIASARCVEVRVPMPTAEMRAYRDANPRGRYRLAASNPNKVAVVGQLLDRHEQDRVLVIGQYLDQLRELARRFDLPLITGKTRIAERERWYARFRSGEVSRLAVSKVGNFAIDLPDANVAIQVSGTFGSRQEEAQRLGRILRPKADGGTAVFYALVSGGTSDQDFAAKRQRFLAEQGYAYEIVELGVKGAAMGEIA